MYHLHCRSCHHEWDSDQEHDICDWCGDDGRVLCNFQMFPEGFLEQFIINFRKEQIDGNSNHR